MNMNLGVQGVSIFVKLKKLHKIKSTYEEEKK